MKVRLNFILLIVLVASIMPATGLYAAPSLRKNVKQAEKMASEPSKHTEARKLMKATLADTLFVPDAYTWNVFALIERESYKHYYKRLSINRNDPSVDLCVMADALMDAYDYSLHCMALDSIKDKKGNLRVKYSPALADWINKSVPAIYNAGIAYMNKKKYWPQAYSSFIKFASMPEMPFYVDNGEIGDSIRANAYFYGGVMAYNSGHYSEAFSAFEKARCHGYTRKEVYLNQISSLSHLARTDTMRRDSLSHIITKIAQEGLRLHGVKNTPVFIQKYVAGTLIEGHPNEALAAIDTALLTQPEMTMLHSMKAGVLASIGDNESAVTEYKIAANSPQADTLTLKNASKFLAEYGISLLDAVSGRNKQARARLSLIHI